MTGVKSNNGVISMDSDATQESNCSKSGGKPVTTLLELAKAAYCGTGVVTTTRVTHATPAATYAHLCNRDLEADIAAQLVPGGAGYNSALKEGWTWYSAAAAASSYPRQTRASARMAATSSMR